MTSPRRLLYREITPAMARLRERRAGYYRSYRRSVTAIRFRTLALSA